MNKFEVGQYVVATKDITLANEEIVLEGTRGQVVGFDRQKLPKVRFIRMEGEISVWNTSIAPDTGSGAADELAQIRADQETRRAFYKSGGPGFRESSDAIDALLAYADKLQAQLAAAQEREAALRAALATIERNTLKDEPSQNVSLDWLQAQAWTLWIIGEAAREALQAAQNTTSDSP